MRQTYAMRPLPCALTEEEIHLKGAELARAALQEAEAEVALERLKTGHKDAVSASKKGLADIRGHRQKLASEISSRSQERDVRCIWRHDLDAGYSYLIREDTGQAVERMRMEQKDRQLAIGERLDSATPEQVAAWEAQLGKPKPAADLADEQAEAELADKAQAAEERGEEHAGDELELASGADLGEDFGADETEGEPDDDPRPTAAPIPAAKKARKGKK